MRWPRLRGRNHRSSSSAQSFAVAMTLVATVAQFFALSHEVTVRHFRCAEHGELTHVAAMVAPAAELPAQRADDAFRARDTEATDAHEHCGVTFTVEGSSCTPSIGSVSSAAPPAPAPRPAPSTVSWHERAFVLASAPKTSPPSA